MLFLLTQLWSGLRLFLAPAPFHRQYPLQIYVDQHFLSHILCWIRSCLSPLPLWDTSRKSLPMGIRSTTSNEFRMMTHLLENDWKLSASGWSRATMRSLHQESGRQRHQRSSWSPRWHFQLFGLYEWSNPRWQRLRDQLQLDKPGPTLLIDKIPVLVTLARSTIPSTTCTLQIRIEQRSTVQM